MTKRAFQKFKRHAGNFYPTPFDALKPLIPFINKNEIICEPCAGMGDLVSHLKAAGFIVPYQFDILNGKDALTITPGDVPLATMFVTNPPWSRDILHRMILHLISVHPIWFLFDSDWAHTVQAAPYMKYCRAIISVGRVKWFKDSNNSGFDNSSWYYFSAFGDSPPRFYWQNYAT